MKLWTMVASLVIAGLLTSGVFAQEGKKKGRGMPSWKDLVGDKTTLDKPTFVAAITKDAPADKAEKRKTYAGRMWDSLAVAAGADKDKTADYVFKSEDDFKAAQAKVREAWKAKKKKAE
jgi:hypothetical protein